MSVPLQRPPSEAALVQALVDGQVSFPPLALEGRRPDGGAADAVVMLRWEGREWAFAVEGKASTTPKAFDAALDGAARAARSLGLRPMLLVPFLSATQLEQLRDRGMSGLDLCGNGIVLVPGELLVLRSGAPNRFRAEGRIKKPYSKNSSIVARVFLLRPEFDSVGEVRDEILARGGAVTLGTVSKVVDALENDLVVQRSPGKSWRSRRLRLLQPEKLLELLEGNYRPPEVRREFLGKTALPERQLGRLLKEWNGGGRGRAVRTGAGSVGAYAVMAREDVRELYCSDVAGLLRQLGGDVRETDRFANLRLLETPDDFVYFDDRLDLLASPLQTYLELAAGDKRDREAAEQVRRRILADLTSAGTAKHAHGSAQDEPDRSAP
jgi:hypothetical protein